MEKINSNFCVVIAVDMGYGHQRTAYPLRNISFEGKVINANNYKGMPERDRIFWQTTRNFYEFISDFKKIPLIGEAIFSIFNKFQQIPAFYPRRDLSKPIFSLNTIFRSIESGWGKDLIEKLKNMPKMDNGKNMPLVNTFFIPAFMAEYFNYPGEIYCVVCDADISRSWVPLNPSKSRIKYLASNSWTRDRLKLYGVKEKNIFLTGYPLPLENIGDEDLSILKKDLKKRLVNLDRKKEYYKFYKILVNKKLGILPKKSDHILTILFSIGGAGAQKEIVFEFLKKLSKKIKNKEIKVILSAGIKEKPRDYFFEKINSLKLNSYLGKNLEVLFEKDINKYFSKFNKTLRKTDILWTKPSELSFYSGLGIPIIIAPSVGSQEDFNRKWLLKIGSGILQENPKYVDQWLFDYLKSGRFAEAAMEGFVEIEKIGVYNIKKIVLG